MRSSKQPQPSRGKREGEKTREPLHGVLPGAYAAGKKAMARWRTRSESWHSSTRFWIWRRHSRTSSRISRKAFSSMDKVRVEMSRSSGLKRSSASDANDRICL